MPKTVKELEIVRIETPCKIDRKMHAADKILKFKDLCENSLSAWVLPNDEQ